MRWVVLAAAILAAGCATPVKVNEAKELAMQLAEGNTQTAEGFRNAARQELADVEWGGVRACIASARASTAATIKLWDEIEARTNAIEAVALEERMTIDQMRAALAHLRDRGKRPTLSEGAKLEDTPWAQKTRAFAQTDAGKAYAAASMTALSAQLTALTEILEPGLRAIHEADQRNFPRPLVKEPVRQAAGRALALSLAEFSVESAQTSYMPPLSVLLRANPDRIPEARRLILEESGDLIQETTVDAGDDLACAFTTTEMQTLLNHVSSPEYRNTTMSEKRTPEADRIVAEFNASPLGQRLIRRSSVVAGYLTRGDRGARLRAANERVAARLEAEIAAASPQR